MIQGQPSILLAYNHYCQAIPLCLTTHGTNSFDNFNSVTNCDLRTSRRRPATYTVTIKDKDEHDNSSKENKDLNMAKANEANIATNQTVLIE